MTRRPIIIDTDPGVDDALALVYALNSPALEVIGVTTVHGNVDLARSTRNALGLLELARPGGQIPVAAGAAEPLHGQVRQDADFVHGVEGLGDTPVFAPRRRAEPMPAWQFLCERIAARPGEITLCAIGPLTNLARALAWSPVIAEQVAGVVIMGGAVNVPGNITAFAEYNVWADPAAAARVFAASWPITLVGLDVTTQVVCTKDDFLSIASRSPRVGGFLAQATGFYLDYYRRATGLPGCHLHDPSALIALTHPECFTGTPMALAVTEDGERRGQTTGMAPPAGGSRTMVMTAVDAAAVRADFMLTLAAADPPCHDS